jgi:hypothetical protein
LSNSTTTKADLRPFLVEVAQFVLQIQVLLNVLGVLLLQVLDLAPQVPHLLQPLLVRLDCRLVLRYLTKAVCSISVLWIRIRTEPHPEARIRIRIRIREKSRIRIRIHIK